MTRDPRILFEHKYISLGKKRLLGIVVPLGKKRLVVLVGSRGYVICGYLNMSVANRFGDVAAKVTGVATITDILKGRVQQASRAARTRGIVPGNPVKKILSVIA